MPFFGREDRTSAEPAVTPMADPRPTPHNPAPRPAASGPAASPRKTVIARGLRIKGTVSGGELVRIDGLVDGKVLVDGGVVIGSDGHVRGRIEASQVTVEGRLDGDLAATEKAEVATSGRVEGDIEAPRVVIAEGAYFKGNVKMGQPSNMAGREGSA